MTQTTPSPSESNIATDTPAAADKKQFTFQAEIKQLLRLLSHSLYQNKDIAIRELVSNASDSLNKLRHLQLTETEFRDETPLEIELVPDAENKVLTIRDSGLGLTHDELIQNLGTIAHSGSLEFLNRLSGDAKADLSLIGQFGVGFYSAFMLADRVEVVTRSYRETTGWRWESDGSGAFTIEPAGDVPRGAQIRLHLKEEASDYLQEWRLKDVVRRYSTFIQHPIRLAGAQLNEQRPIWVEPRSQLTDEQYKGFYEFLTHQVDESPLWRLHTSSDSPLQFTAILYCPPRNPELMGFGPADHGLHLCAKRILVQDDCSELLPDYLRFLHGLVDSADLPLNVSRETLQDSALLRKIRKVLVRKVLDHLATLAEENAETYRSFIDQFGSILRTGIATDFENRDRVAKLLRYRSTFTLDNETPGIVAAVATSAAAPAVTSLEDYVKRMRAEQSQIYFASGVGTDGVSRSPGLEVFRRKQLEVLFLADPSDEVMFSHLREFDGKRLVSIDAEDVELPPDVGSTEQEDSAPADPPGFSRVMELFRNAVGDRVTEVRNSRRLIDSPCCLVNSSGGMSIQLQRALQAANRDYVMPKPTLEVNAQSALLQRLAALSQNTANDAFITQCGEQLLADALLREGLTPDADETTRRVQSFMLELAEKRSSIVLA